LCADFVEAIERAPTMSREKIGQHCAGVTKAPATVPDRIRQVCGSPVRADVHYIYREFALFFLAMTRAFLSVLTTALIVAMTLGAMFTLVRATVWVTSMESPLQRSVGIVAELFLGVVLLLGTVWLATHLAVRIFGVKESLPPGGPLG